MLTEVDILRKKFVRNIFTDKKINDHKQAEYLLLLGKLIKNGFSLKQSVNCLRLISNDEVFRKIYKDLQQGKTISFSLRHLDLPKAIYNQLIIAQTHGSLQKILMQSGLILQTKAKQKNKLKELLAYPLFIIGFLFVMLMGMKLYVIPQLGMGSETKYIDLFLQVFFGLIFFGSLTLMIYVKYLQTIPEYKSANQLIKLPILGKIYLNFYQFIILQGLGLQVASGLNLREICSINLNFASGSLQEMMAKKIESELRKGSSLNKIIRKEKFLPNELKSIFQLGGGKSELAQDLILMSELKFEETQKSLKKILNLVQPIMFGIIALIIIATYLIVLLPVYGMMKGMS
ncbi:type II secretion system F family protein [Companilactobacillus baiquanensis]|uniref:Type II secretion system F family protein n=1 Tax=Companilactobacillus baiquanensis TaxID=2486005 RepID=A0ABW1UVV5_9LACO|nr:type II secretion system F family protein [Companilactobacillus baiquanensis]